MNIYLRILSVCILFCTSFAQPQNAYAAPIPPDIKKTVTFIFLADKDGKLKVHKETKEPIPNGTGFFVSVQEERAGEKKDFSYLVTAKHVLADPAGGIYTRIFVRLNKLGGGFDFVPVDLLRQQVFTSGDSSADIAAVPLTLNPAIADAKTVPLEMIANREAFKSLNVAEGSDVFFVGLFASYYGEKRNNPVVRFGKVAMVPEDRISFGSPEKSWLYLIEAQSYGGNSGSPVFVSLGIDRDPNRLFIGPPQIVLAGIMKGFFGEQQPVKFQEIETKTGIVPVSLLNSGIAAISPAYILHDLLLSPELAQNRSSSWKK